MLVEIKNNDELSNIIKSEDIILIDLYANWCSPCKLLLPLIEEISNEINEVLFFKYNVESDSPNLLNSMGIKNIPTVLIFKGGVELSRFNGYKDKKFITELLNDIIKNEKTNQ